MKQKIYNDIKGRKPEIWVDLTADPKIKKIDLEEYGDGFQMIITFKSNNRYVFIDYRKHSIRERLM